MASLALVKEMCRERSLDSSSCIDFLKMVLKIGGKDLRTNNQLVMKILDSMRDKPQDEILRALEITTRKSEQIEEDLHPNYFIAVLSKASPNLSQYKDDKANLQWGKSI